MITLFIGCNKKDNIKKNNKAKISSKNTVNDPDCVEFVALWPAGDIAEKLGKDKKWIFLNYTVDLWDKPPSIKKGNIVGKLRASSYARILDNNDNDYKVESPKKEQGWISREHVKTTSWKNPKTNKLCK
tara:strand:+ start:257 stop:643 length:387 start_codon:yes stop_codon:yes gene_type:complete